MCSYEEGVMNILRYEPDEQFGSCTPESFVARPVVCAAFTLTTFFVQFPADSWAAFPVNYRREVVARPEE